MGTTTDQVLVTGGRCTGKQTAFERELLEMAAKAARYPIHSDAWACGPGGGKPKLYMGNGGPVWNPRDDDGDALRLAVRLGLLVYVLNDVGVTAIRLPDSHVGGKYDVVEHHGSDPGAATRLAILLAAAAIGRAMA